MGDIMKNAELLAEMAKHIRTVPIIDTTNGATYAEKDCPACLVCNAIRAGLVDEKLVESTRKLSGESMDFPGGFSHYFDVSFDEACKVIFIPHRRNRHDRISTGENYYIACKELLDKYGYGYLLEETEERKELYLEQFTPATQSFKEMIEGVVA